MRYVAIAAVGIVLGLLVLAALSPVHLSPFAERVVSAGFLGWFSGSFGLGWKALTTPSPITRSTACIGCGAASRDLTTEEVAQVEAQTVADDVARLNSLENAQRTRRFVMIAPLVIAGLVAVLFGLRLLIGD